MNQMLFDFDFWLIAVGALFIIRYYCLILAAEQGRKRDLTRKLYRANFDFNISVLIPYLDVRKRKSLNELIEAIEKQDYPGNKVFIHIVGTDLTTHDLYALRNKKNIHLWTYPVQKAASGDAIWWLIERCKASGSAGLMVFLKPDDIIKPDFFQNIAARSLECAIMQGYVAIKKRPETLLGKVIALSDRLTNRVDNAGRYHMGQSPQLMDSGWVIKQEVLEMIPYRRGWDLSNLEYTLALNLEGFRVTWAPNVVIYSNEQTSLAAYLTDFVASFFNRLQLFLIYGLRLMMASVKKQDFGYFEQLTSLIKPPHFLTGLFLIAMAMMSAMSTNPLPGKPWSWGGLAIAFAGAQLLAMFVARSRSSDYMTYFLVTPLIYAAGLVMAPVGLLNYLTGLLNRAEAYRERKSYRRITKTRFNETLESRPATQLQDEGPELDETDEDAVEAPLSTADFEKIYQREQHKTQTPPVKPKSKYAQPVARPSLTQGLPVQSSQNQTVIKKAPPTPSNTREFSKTVAVSNGEKEINCILKTVTAIGPNGEETTQMSLVYKTVAFSTGAYRLPEQAYYELHAKLKTRGYTLMTCGSCGYFYNPTSDLSEPIKNAGVCLFGKNGKELNLKTDGVTTLSTACLYHADLDLREQKVRDWRKSLTPETAANLSS